MDDTEVTREVSVPVAACWDLLTDPERVSDWLTVVTAVTAQGPPGVGQRLHARGEVRGARFDIDVEVDRHDAPSDYGWRGDDPVPMQLRVALTATGDATTRITLTVGADLSGVRLGKRLVRRSIRTHLHRSADQLVALLDTDAEPQPS